MNRNRFEELARRKETLIFQAGRERAELAAACRRVQASLDLKQALLALGRTLKAHPAIAAGASGLLASGLAGKLLKGAGQAAAITRMAIPLWAWWWRRRKP